MKKIWWIIGGLFFLGIAQKILESLQEEVAVERQRWEDSYQKIQTEVCNQQIIIEQKLKNAAKQLNYAELSNLHSASVKLADTTYQLLQDSRKTLDAMGEAIVSAAKQRKKLQQRKRLARGSEAQKLAEEISSLYTLRDEILIPDKDQVKDQRNRLLEEVRRLNKQTAELRDLKNSIRASNRYPPQKKLQSFPEKKAKGIVKFYNLDRGFGFIIDIDGMEVYFNKNQFKGINSLKQGDFVEFILKKGENPWAAKITKLRRDIKRVIFSLPKETTKYANRVNLVGDFNNWNQNSLVLQKKSNGIFSLEIELEKGKQYQYRFLIDGIKWVNDQNADKFVPNNFGSKNSMKIL